MASSPSTSNPTCPAKQAILDLSHLASAIAEINERLRSIEERQDALMEELATQNKANQEVMEQIRSIGIAQMTVAGKLTSVVKEDAAHSLATTSSPIARVFGTTELLEAVLVNLPMRDLLFAQKVCKSFQQTITASPSLRRALFLDPAPAMMNGVKSNPVINPLLQHIGTLDGARAWLVIADKYGSPRMLHIRSGFHTGSNGLERVDVEWRKPYVLLPKGTVYAESSAMCYAKGSWRDMYLTQPPCDVVRSLPPYMAGKSQVERKARPVSALKLGRLWAPKTYFEAEPRKLLDCFKIERQGGNVREGVELKRK